MRPQDPAHLGNPNFDPSGHLGQEIFTIGRPRDLQKSITMWFGNDIVN